MKPLQRSLLRAATACLLAAAAAHAQSGNSSAIYKWVDQKSVTHYSESPPPSGSAQQLDIQGAPAPVNSQPAAPGKSLQQQEIEFRQRQREREAAEEQEAFGKRVNAMNEKMHKQACADARARLASLQANRRAPLFRKDPATGQMVADFEARGLEIERLAKAIDENCPPE